MSVGAVNKQTGDRIPTAGMPAIDDALDLTSTNPVQNDIITAALANKQDKTDNSLQTTDKTVVGAINEHEGDIGSLMSGLTNLGKSANMSNWNDYADFNGKYVIIGKLCIFNLSVTKGDASWNLAGIPNQQAAIDNTAVAYDAVNQKRIFAKNTTGAIVLQLQVTDTYTNATNVSGCIVLA